MTILPYVRPYDPRFLGSDFVVPLPRLSDATRDAALAGGRVYDYIHYSLVMHGGRRTALYAAANVDGARKVSIPRSTASAAWRTDPRIGDENQVGDAGYGGEGGFDRGHLVRREDVQWGTREEALAAAKSTFFYSNAAPQHAKFNQDEWLQLEDYVLDAAVDGGARLCVFSGPVLDPDDPPFGSLPDSVKYRRLPEDDTRVPMKFWKVIVVRIETNAGLDLAALAFLMDQTDLWHDHSRAAELAAFQVPVSQVEQLTGLQFGELQQIDELSLGGGDGRSGPVRVTKPSDLVFPSASRRAGGTVLATGLRSPANNVLTPPEAASEHRAPCGCGDSDKDQRLAALEARVAALTQVVAGLASRLPTSSPPPTGALRGLVPRALPTGPTVSPSAWDPIAELVTSGALRERLRRVGAWVTENSAAPGAPATPEVAVRRLGRIVGGEEADWTQWPSCVCVGDGVNWFCTGVVITPIHVLTAAHCAMKRTGPSLPPLVFHSGNVVDQPAAHQLARVRRGWIHESVPLVGTRPQVGHDICLIELDAPLPATVRPATLSSLDEVRAATEATFAGFGASNLDATAGAGRLRTVTTPVFCPPPGAAPAAEAKLGFDAAREFVGGSKDLPHRDTCRGDSGGPAYIHVMTAQGAVTKLAGLTSRATAERTHACGDGGIYTLVPAFADWLFERGVRLDGWT